MKLFVIASMLFGGGTAAALNNEEVADTLKEKVPAIVRERFQNRVEDRKENRLETLREDGILYPAEARFAELTVDQQLAITTLIDQYNLENDFANLTDEEIQVVFASFHEDMVLLLEELGLEMPVPDKEQIRDRIRKNVTSNLKERYQHRMDQAFENIRENGFTLREATRLELTDEQTLAIEARVAAINESYEFSDMTDEELKLALAEIKLELHELFTELEIELPDMGQQLQKEHNHQIQESRDAQGSKGSQRRGK